MRATELENVNGGTLAVIKRKLDAAIGIHLDEDGQIQCRTRLFSDVLGTSTIRDICDALESGKSNN